MDPSTASAITLQSTPLYADTPAIRSTSVHDHPCTVARPHTIGLPFHANHSSLAVVTAYPWTLKAPRVREMGNVATPIGTHREHE